LAVNPNSSMTRLLASLNSPKGGLKKANLRPVRSKTRSFKVFNSEVNCSSVKVVIPVSG